MALKDLQKGTRILETIENYSVSDKIGSDCSANENSKRHLFCEDKTFWDYVIDQPPLHWGMMVDLDKFIISDWIARVPGLYWSPSSALIRRHTEMEIEFEDHQQTIFQPIGKSRKVLGGIGTIMLPPTEDGKVLVSASSHCNASTGIPLLIFPEVFGELEIKQGDCVQVRGARWQPMDVHWAFKFASTKDIPRGYLVIDSIDKLIISERNIPVLYHPFSLMEYEYNNSLFYDYVYVTAYSKDKDVDARIKKFFIDYAKAKRRYGEYLLNPNVVNPIFPSRYLSPIELSSASEKAKLAILNERIRQSNFSKKSIRELATKIPQFYSSVTSIKTLAKNIEINISLLVEDSPINMAFQLIELCIKREMIENLIDRVTLDYPELFY